MNAGLRDIRGKKLFVEDTGGDGPTLLCIHGLGGTTSFYEPLVRPLGGRVRLVRYDFDGHGRSPLTGPLGVVELAEDAAALIETLPGRRAHVMAHSLGTLVAQELAGRRPDLVASLLLVGPVRAQGEAAKAATRARAATVRDHGMAAVADSIAENATAEAARAENPLVKALVRELLLGQDAESYAQACEALAAAEDPDLAKIRAPTLLLAGADDKLSTEAVLAELKAGVAGARSAVTPACGHWTVAERPAFVAEQALAFIENLRHRQGSTP